MMASNIINDSGAVRFSPRKTLSRKYCCVYGCTSNARKNYDVRFHRFPKPNRAFVRITNDFGDFEQVDCRRMWIEALKIERNVTDHMVVCSLHFTKNDYILPDQSRNQRYLKINAVPSYNLPNAEDEEKITRKRHRLESEEKKMHNNCGTENSMNLINLKLNNDNRRVKMNRIYI